MPFAQKERELFVSALQKHGWILEGGTVSSPTGGLWFDEDHFEMWSPKEMQEIFIPRANRIGQAMVGDDWESAWNENTQVHQVLDVVLGKSS